MLGILGTLGSGKTTLLHTIAGLHTPRLGLITAGLTPVDALTDANRQRDLGHLLQDIKLFPCTIGENTGRFVDTKGIEAQVKYDVFTPLELLSSHHLPVLTIHSDG